MEKRIAVIYRVQPSFINRQAAIAYNEIAVLRFLQEHSGENFEIDLLEPLDLPGHRYLVVKSYTAQEFQANLPHFQGPDVIYQAYTRSPFFHVYTGTFDNMEDLHYWMTKQFYDSYFCDSYMVKVLQPSLEGFYKEIETRYREENGLEYSARFNTFAQNK